MRVRAIIDDDNAVSPVIGVILMVAITVILAAVIATFVLGLGEQVSDPSPNTSFTFDYENSTPSQTSYADSPGTTRDGKLTITHAGGPNIVAEQLFVTGASDDGVSYPQPWGEDDTTSLPGPKNEPQYQSDDEISSGDSIEVGVDLGDTVTVTWENEEGTESSTLARYRVGE